MLPGWQCIRDFPPSGRVCSKCWEWVEGPGSWPRILYGGARKVQEKLEHRQGCPLQSMTKGRLTLLTSGRLRDKVQDQGPVRSPRPALHELRSSQTRRPETRGHAVYAGQRGLGGAATIFRAEAGRSDQRRPVGTSRGRGWFGTDLRTLSALRARARLQRLPRAHHAAGREQRQRQDLADSACDARIGFGPV